jgi:hypothetical protein
MDRYDWMKATRGRLAKQLAAEGSNSRALDDDLAIAFPDSASVNAALRAVLLVRQALGPGRSRRKPRPA